MSNERLGIYDELRARAKLYAEQGDSIRRRVLHQGPTSNGAYAQPANPFNTIPLRLKNGKPHIHGEGVHGRRRPVFKEARLGLNIAQVVQAVSQESDVPYAEMFSDHRMRRVAWPRHVAMWMVDRYCPEYSLPELAYVFGRDHTTVMHAIEAVTKRIARKCPDTLALVANVHQRLAALQKQTSPKKKISLRKCLPLVESS